MESKTNMEKGSQTEYFGQEELEQACRKMNEGKNPGFWGKVKSGLTYLHDLYKTETETKRDTKMENEPIEVDKIIQRMFNKKVKAGQLGMAEKFAIYGAIAAAAIYGGVDVYQTATEKKQESKPVACRTIDEKVSGSANQPVRDRTLVVPDLQQRLEAAQKTAPTAAAKPVYENRGLAIKTNSDFDTGKPIEYSKLEALGLSYEGKEKIKALKGPFMQTPNSKIPVYGNVNCMAVLENGQEICYGMSSENFKQLKDAYKGEYGVLK